jgi:hypothetical protein
MPKSRAAMSLFSFEVTAESPLGEKDNRRVRASGPLDAVFVARAARGWVECSCRIEMVDDDEESQ